MAIETNTVRIFCVSLKALFALLGFFFGSAARYPSANATYNYINISQQIAF
jgi:hypothetical protein